MICAGRASVDGLLAPALDRRAVGGNRLAGVGERPRGQGGLKSQFFVFYYPLLLAFALVFPPKATLSFTVLTLGAYSLACFIADPAFFVGVGDLKLFVMRVITLTAMGGLGTYYWRVQRNQRRALMNRPVPLPLVEARLEPQATGAQG